MCRWKERKKIQLIIWHSQRPVKHSSPLALAANARQDTWMMCLDNTCWTSCCSSSTDDNVFLTPRFSLVGSLSRAQHIRSQGLLPCCSAGGAEWISTQWVKQWLVDTLAENQGVSCQVVALNYGSFNVCVGSWTNTLVDMIVLSVIDP